MGWFALALASKTSARIMENLGADHGGAPFGVTRRTA
jgi:hypothetical protein